MATVKGNNKVAKSRGEAWVKSLIKGKMEAQLNPTILKTLRIKKAVSQAELASLIKVSLATYGGIERAKKAAAKNKAEAIASRLGSSLNSIFKPTKKENRYVAIFLKKGSI